MRPWLKPDVQLVVHVPPAQRIGRCGTLAEFASESVKLYGVAYEGGRDVVARRIGAVFRLAYVVYEIERYAKLLVGIEGGPFGRRRCGGHGHLYLAWVYGGVPDFADVGDTSVLSHSNAVVYETCIH